LLGYLVEMPILAFPPNSEREKYFQFLKSIKALPGKGCNAIGSNSTAVHFIKQIAHMICTRE
jgi:hypothetical protein